jgi:hypothetical protein
MSELALASVLTTSKVTSALNGGGTALTVLYKRNRPRTPTARASATSTPLPGQSNFEATFLIDLLLVAIAYLDLISRNHRYDTFSDPIVNIWVSVCAVNFVLPPALAARGLAAVSRHQAAMPSVMQAIAHQVVACRTEREMHAAEAADEASGLIDEFSLGGGENGAP